MFVHLDGQAIKDLRNVLRLQPSDPLPATVKELTAYVKDTVHVLCTFSYMVSNGHVGRSLPLAIWLHQIHLRAQDQGQQI